MGKYTRKGARQCCKYKGLLAILNSVAGDDFIDR